MDNKKGMTSLTRLFMPFVRRHTKYLVATLFLTLGATVAALAIPFATGASVNALSNAKSAGEFFGSNSGLIFILIGLFVLQAGFSYFRVTTSAKLSEGLVRDLRMALFSEMLDRPLAFFDKRTPGDLASRLTKDVSNVQELITDGSSQMLTGLFTSVGAIIGMLYISWPLSALSLLLIPITLFTVLRYRKRIRKAAKTQLEKLGDMNSRVLETASQMKAVKAFSGHRHETDIFSKSCSSFYDSGLSLAKVLAVYTVINKVALWAVVVALIIFGFSLVGDGSLTNGSLLAFVMLAFKFSNPLLRMSYFFSLMQKSVPAAGRIYEVIDSKMSESVKFLNRKKLSAPKGELELKDVKFSYNERDVLSGVNLDAKPGQLVALAGSSGAGKTTVFNLILGFYEAAAGTVTIDGMPYEHLDLKDLRRHFAYVPQEPMLFDGTIGENIAYAKPGADRDSVENAAKMAGIWDFINNLEEGLDTPVGIIGSRLSGGERQRIAIARALLRNPSVIMLDEPTSSLDAENESRFKKVLEDMKKDRTVLVIAHRLTTVMDADRIYVLDSGRVTEFGTHDELMNKSGIYAGFWGS